MAEEKDWSQPLIQYCGKIAKRAKWREIAQRQIANKPLIQHGQCYSDSVDNVLNVMNSPFLKERQNQMHPFVGSVHYTVQQLMTT